MVPKAGIKIERFVLSKEIRTKNGLRRDHVTLGREFLHYC
jgi:hypothetical protein